ncbi:MAG: hypothetical protein ACHBN1_10045 [Heteroscytonema crispum UTEX LB 1556]
MGNPSTALRTNNQQPTINHQPSTINHQPTTQRENQSPAVVLPSRSAPTPTNPTGEPVLGVLPSRSTGSPTTNQQLKNNN